MKQIECDVVLIDSGVSSQSYEAYRSNIIGYRSFCTDDNDYEDISGHGTAIFSRIISSDATIFIIKIFNEILEVDEDLLVFALNYVNEHIKCKVINMSLGITQCVNIKNLRDICFELTQKGILIISAFDNSGAISYPAAFPFVIGVDNCVECVNKDEYIIVYNSAIDIKGFGGLQRVSWHKNVPFSFVSGSSFATANITKLILDYLLYNQLKTITVEEAKTALLTNSKKTIQHKARKIIAYPTIKKAIAFPLNKELTSLINYRELLTFELKNIYDFRVSGNVNKTICSIYGDKEYRVLDIEKIVWDNQFDTVIISHVRELERLLKKDILNDFISLCLEHNKQVFCFDVINSIESIRNVKNDMVFHTPYIDNKYLINNNGKLAMINAPVLGVFGTSSHQGKYTLQLFLRKRFLNSGYKIAQMGTEPSGFMFGMDKVFPMGYNSSVNMNFRETICYINQEMQDMDSNKPDIILIGSQSNTTLYYPGNISQYPTSQLELLYGTMPDAVVLCVNIHDDCEYIEKTVCNIESIGYAKVIAFGLYPMDKKNDYIMSRRKPASMELLESKINNLKKRYNVPVFVIGNEEQMGELFNYSVDWFSREV